RAGLAQVGGKMALYRKLLEKFRTSHCAEFEPKMRAALASSDWPAAVRLAHSLKGVARTLGAFALGDLALAVEQAARASDAEAMAPALAALNVHLNNLRQALADLKPHTAAAPAADGTTHWRVLLERLQELLAQFDSEAGDVVRELAGMSTDTMTRVRVTRLTEAVDAYRYEEAAKLAAALLASLATTNAALETT
ncbi:MAG: Hpt domain-containing protein, partial [Rhodocyclaceae bacterium]|nr:Hpt domain-containing protein [Rhodocyclaceae bacterium]